MLTDKQLYDEIKRAVLSVWPPTTLHEQVAVWRLVVAHRPRATVEQITRETFDVYDTVVAERDRTRFLATKERRGAIRSEDPV